MTSKSGIKHIGIAATSAPGAALCYQTLCSEGAEFCGSHDHPEITLHTLPLRRYMDAFEANDWLAVGAMLLDSAEKLKSAGADFAICPANTPHQGLDLVRERSPLPWVHIADAVANEAATRGYRKLGILGTKYLMEGPVYDAALAAKKIEHVVPEKDARNEINRLIFDELVKYVFLPSTVAYFQSVIRQLKEQGCDAVVMGCTEIPLII